MATVNPLEPDNLAELVEQLGDVPPHRIRLKPPPGMAREKDVTATRAGIERRLCELVDGVLVEKSYGLRESVLAIQIVHGLWNAVESEDRGIILGPDGMFRLWPGLVRIPDVSFTSWERLPGHTVPDVPFLDGAPDLVVEVLNDGDAKREVERKVREYFQAGARLIWLIRSKASDADVYTSPTDVRRVGKNGTLDGGEILPGFRLSLKDLFARVAPRRKGA